MGVLVEDGGLVWSDVLLWCFEFDVGFVVVECVDFCIDFVVM